MTVGRDYLMKQPSAPSAPKLFFDTRVVPYAVNAAGGVEVALDRAARRIGVRPAAIMAGGVAAVVVAAGAWRRRRAASPAATD